jgi:Kef-type K+ transport system membrane component KefB
MLGFDTMTSLFLGIAFAFSSTIVVLKLLSDKEEMESTFGRLSIGILIVQDLIVILLMIGIATFKSIHIGEVQSFGVIAILIGKLVAIIAGLYMLSKYFIPKITKKIAESQEYLFLFSIGRCFILGAIFHRL